MYIHVHNPAFIHSKHAYIKTHIQYLKFRHVRFESVKKDIHLYILICTGRCTCYCMCRPMNVSLITGEWEQANLYVSHTTGTTFVYYIHAHVHVYSICMLPALHIP